MAEPIYSRSSGRWQQLSRASRAHPAGAEAVDRDVRLRDLMASCRGPGRCKPMRQRPPAICSGPKNLLAKASAERRDDVSLHLKLAAMQRATGRSDAALATVHRALTISPLDFTALLLRASLLDRMNQPEAPEAWSHALAQKPKATCRRTCSRSSRRGKRASSNGPPSARARMKAAMAGPGASCRPAAAAAARSFPKQRAAPHSALP